MYQCSKKLATHKGCSCFDQSDFPAHSMFTFDVCWGSLGTKTQIQPEIIADPDYTCGSYGYGILKKKCG